MSHARTWGFQDFRGPSPWVHRSTRLSVLLPRTKRAFASPDPGPLDRRQGRGAWGATGAAALPAAVAAEPRPFACSALRRGDRPKVSPARQRMQSGSSIVPLLRGEYRLCNSYVHQGIRSVSAVLVSRSC